MPFDEDELLTLQQVADHYGVTKILLLRHVAFDGHPPQKLPPLEAVIVGGVTMFTPFQTRAFFRTYHAVKKANRKRPNNGRERAA